jgi:hypothetical protein
LEQEEGQKKPVILIIHYQSSVTNRNDLKTVFVAAIAFMSCGLDYADMRVWNDVQIYVGQIKYYDF